MHFSDYKNRFLGLVALFIYLSSFCGSAVAVRIDDLYNAEIEVVGQTKAAREKAFATALWGVLLKVTGNPSIPSMPEIQPLFQDAGGLVQQYHYQALQPAGGSARRPSNRGLDFDVVSGAATKATHVLSVKFAAEALNKQLNQLGIPIWDKDRPATLLWLLVQNKKDRYLLGANHPGDTRMRVEALAKTRGLPVLFPVLDFEDRGKVTDADIRGNFAFPVLEASKRYGVNSVLTANLTQSRRGQWTAQWTLHRNSQSSSWRNQADDFDAAILTGLGALAEMLSAELAVGGWGSQSEVLSLVINNVQNADDYARVLNYLQNLSIIERVDLTSMSTDKVQLSLKIKGGQQNLQSNFKQGGVLSHSPSATSSPTENTVLIYNLLR